MALLLPSLAAVRYTGKLSPRRLWEVGGADIPYVRTGDIVIVPAITAVTLVRRGEFEEVAVKEVASSFMMLPEAGRVEVAKLTETDKDTPPADKDTPPADKDTPPADKDTPPADKDTPPVKPVGTEMVLPGKTEIMKLSKEKLIEIAKYVGVSVKSKTKNDLIALILPYLPDGDDAGL